MADEARQAAVRRPRGVIFNNDGGDCWSGSAPVTKEGFLSITLDHIGNCGLPTMIYSTSHSFNLCTHDSKVTEPLLATTGSWKNNRLGALLKLGTDPLKLAIEVSRKHNIEIFWSLRMNDIHDHDPHWPELMPQWKKDNPRFLMGRPEDYSKYPPGDLRRVWTVVDFAHKQVRDQVVATIRDVLERYEVDGIELDFLRYWWYFKETMVGQPVTGQHLDMLTEMVVRIRKEVLAASDRTAKPILLFARVLPTLALNQRFGFDVEQWGKEGYVDFLVLSGGYDPFTAPVKDMIDRGHAWGIPLYVCLSSSGMISGTVKGCQQGNTIECWRAAAANAWMAGADGIVTFNLFPDGPGSASTQLARRTWKEIGNPEALVGKDKLYCIENLEWCIQWGCVEILPAEDRLPVEVKKGSAVTRVLPVADDIQGLKGRLKTLRLRICLSGLQAGDKVRVKMNGVELEISTAKDQWLAADVPPSSMKKGRNIVAVTFDGGDSNSLTVTAVELAVKYKG